MELGLITRMKVLETRIEIDNRAEKIRQNNNQIKQLSIQKLQAQNRIREELLDLESQIQMAQDELEGLQNSLRMDSKAISVFTGRVISVDVALGDVVQTGSRLMTIEKTGQHSRFLQAILYVPANQGKRIVTGMRVHVSPSTVKKDQYGSIMGLVTYVSAFPTNREAMKRVTSERKNGGGTLVKTDRPVEVKVALVPDSLTYQLV